MRAPCISWTQKSAAPLGCLSGILLLATAIRSAAAPKNFTSMKEAKPRFGGSHRGRCSGRPCRQWLIPQALAIRQLLRAQHLRRYDDGGHSGASLDRPALKKLLTDVRAGKIAIVVVYKVDRLTRSTEIGK
jgi:Resolvase, N terminal domain